VTDGFLISVGEKGLGRTTKKALHFKDTIFHRIIPGFMAQVSLIEEDFFHLSLVALSLFSDYCTCVNASTLVSISRI